MTYKEMEAILTADNTKTATRPGQMTRVHALNGWLYHGPTLAENAIVSGFYHGTTTDDMAATDWEVEA